MHVYVDSSTTNSYLVMHRSGLGVNLHCNVNVTFSEIRQLVNVMLEQNTANTKQ